MGDVYYRLSDFEAAQQHYESALSMVSKIDDGTEREMMLKEKLRALEGLVSIAFDFEETAESESLIEAADEVAKQLRDEFDNDLYPTYFGDFDTEMTTEEIEQLENGCADRNEVFVQNPQSKSNL